MMLIENNYRAQTIKLAYGDEKFSVPKNIYIIGIMNTADRGIAMRDYALRRRFSFFDLKPAFENERFMDYIKSFKSERIINLVEKIKILNKEIKEILEKPDFDRIAAFKKQKICRENAMHRNLMRMFRLYMLIGGMPQAVEAYLEHNNLQVVDEVKREIVDLYKEDFTKIDGTGLAGDIYDAIPASLSGNASRYVLSNAREGTRLEQVRELIPDILSSYTVNIAYHANNPGVGMSLEKDAGRYKLFTSDVGLFITLAFKDKKYTENIIYNKLLSDKLEANLGYIYENVVAQMLVARGNNLFYYTMESDTSNHLYEIDFLLSKGDKINPIEVKSGNYRGHKSLDMFCDKYSSRIRDQYVVHTKDYKLENGIHYLPVYMIPFL